MVAFPTDAPILDIYTGSQRGATAERMGILFRKAKEEVHEARVLVCAIDSRFADVLKTDADIYRRDYPATSTAVFPSINALLKRLEEKYDVVHLLADVTETGAIRDTCGDEVAGTQLIQRCCEHDVKLLWVASDNPADRYIKGFAARGKRLNLVMTLQRKGTNFPTFLQNIFSRMAYGEAMPVAWNAICPQIPQLDHVGAPESIFFAGRGAVRLLA